MHTELDVRVLYVYGFRNRTESDDEFTPPVLDAEQHRVTVTFKRRYGILKRDGLLERLIGGGMLLVVIHRHRSEHERTRNLLIRDTELSYRRERVEKIAR